MSIETEGFLSADLDAYVAFKASQPSSWRKLTRDLNRTVQRLMRETVIADARELADPRLLSRMLLGRALSNYQGVILLAERGLAAESRTLARACLETTFCLSAVLNSGEPFIDRLLEDARKHRRMLARNLLEVRTEASLGEAISDKLRAFLENLPSEAPAKWLPTEEVAKASGLHQMFVFYRELSADAHPTIASLERYVIAEGERLEFQWGVEAEPEILNETLFYGCTFLITAGVAFNNEVAKNETISEELSRHWTRLCDLQEAGVAQG